MMPTVMMAGGDGGNDGPFVVDGLLLLFVFSLDFLCSAVLL